MKIMSIIGIILFTFGLTLHLLLPDDSGDNQWFTLLKGLWIFYIRYIAVSYGLSLSIVGIVTMGKMKTMIVLSIIGIFLFVFQLLVIIAQVQTSDNLMRIALLYSWLIYGLIYSIVGLNIPLIMKK